MSNYNTKQRAILINFMENNTDCLLSAAQITQGLKNSNISKSAVYRNLALLEQDGKIKRHSKNGTREVYYQYTDTKICKGCLHLQCKKCGKTFHMNTKQADSIVKNVAKTDEFQIDRTQTVFYGVCKSCKEN